LAYRALCIQNGMLRTSSEHVDIDIGLYCPRVKDACFRSLSEDCDLLAEVDWLSMLLPGVDINN